MLKYSNVVSVSTENHSILIYAQCTMEKNIFQVFKIVPIMSWACIWSTSTLTILF